MYAHEIIKARRLQLYPVQKDFSNKIGMSLSGYRKIEQGQIDFKVKTENLERICDALNLDIDLVIDGKYEMILVPITFGRRIKAKDVKRRKQPRYWSRKKKEVAVANA